jgi:pimeloyl-ACP methyl ester carboxylesterase
MGSWSTELFCNNDDAVNDAEAWLEFFLSYDVVIPQEWTIDPITGTYAWLRSAIVQAGLPEQDVPYDWRQSIPDIVDAYLIPMIDQVKAEFGVNQVNIVAHSMGGLIVRYYIQSSSYPERSDVRKFAMIGVPQQGAVDAYFTWEGGEFIISDIGDLPKKRILDYMKQGCGRADDPDVQFVREEILSVGQLMPTFPFIQRFNSQSFVPIEEMCLKNDFLLALNESALNPINSGVSSKAFASASEQTLRSIPVTLPFCDSEKWPDGVPLHPLFGMSSGDETVLFDESAYPVDFIPEFAQIPIEEVSGAHDELPDSDEVTSKVVEFLTE